MGVLDDIQNYRWLSQMELSTRLVISDLQLNRQGQLELRALEKFTQQPVSSGPPIASELGIIEVCLYVLTYRVNNAGLARAWGMKGALHGIGHLTLSELEGVLVQEYRRETLRTPPSIRPISPLAVVLF